MGEGYQGLYRACIIDDPGIFDYKEVYCKLLAAVTI